MEILHTRNVTRFGQPFTVVLTRGCVKDCAAYSMAGMCNPHDVAAHGEKLPASDALVLFDLPEDHHYRR